MLIKKCKCCKKVELPNSGKGSSARKYCKNCAKHNKNRIDSMHNTGDKQKINKLNSQVADLKQRLGMYE